MAPVSAKRGRAAKSPNSPRSPKRAKAADPVAEKVQLVSETLSDPVCAISGPEAHREMLLASIPYTLPVPSDERHAFQTEIAQMIGQILTDHVADQEKQVTDSKSEVDAAAQKETEQMNVVEASSAMINAQEEKIQTCKSTLNEDSETLKSAESTLASAKKEVAEFDGELQKVIDQKDHNAAVYNECFLLMKSEDCEAKDAPKHLKRIEPTLRQLDCEKSLLSAIAPALKKAHADRGAFDHMAIEGAEGVFSKTLAELQNKIDKADEVKAEKVKAETIAGEALAAAMEKHGTSKAALSSATEELKSLSAKHKELLAALDKASSVESAAQTQQAQKENSLTHAKDVLAAFNELLERTSAIQDKVTAMEEASSMETATVS